MTDREMRAFPCSLAMVLVACGSRSGVLSAETDHDIEAGSPTRERDAALFGADADAFSFDAAYDVGLADDVADGPREASIGACDVVAIATGGRHTCAVTRGGDTFCWGNNSQGQIGRPIQETKALSPVRVAGLPANIVAIAAGAEHTCALSQDGSVYCFGRNQEGQLGDGTTGSGRSDPVRVPVIAALQIDTAANTSFARLADGSVRGWGSDGFGELGDIKGALQPLPVPIAGIARDVSYVSAGSAGTVCARKFDGTLWCWGWNDYGLVDPTKRGPSAPVQKASLGTSVAQVSLGFGHACVLKIDGTVWCWGIAYNGQLGTGPKGPPAIEPERVEALGNVTDVTAGASHTCAISNRRLLCWGLNADGQLGDAKTVQQDWPVRVHLISQVVAVSAGGMHTCASLRGVLFCWGSNVDGQVGDGSTETRTIPARVDVCPQTGPQGT